MNFEELKNPKHDIINIAKPRSLRLLSMVQTPSPIDRNIRIPPIKLSGGADGAAGGGLAEWEEPRKNRAVVADVEPLEVARLWVVKWWPAKLRRYGGKEADVVVGVEAADVAGTGGEGAVDLHAAVKRVVDDQIVGHPDPMGLHWVPLPVVVVADCRLVEVRHTPLLRVGARRRREGRATKYCAVIHTPSRSPSIALPRSSLYD